MSVGSANVRSLEDMGNIVLPQQNGVPVLLSDISRYRSGSCRDWV